MYPGFKLLGKLPSINKQRLIQRKVLEHILLCKQSEGIKFLSIGVGDGEELNALLTSQILRSTFVEVICVDILNNYFNPYYLSNLKNIVDRVTFIQDDVRNLSMYFTQEEFDIVQCGFLIHEVKYEDKNDVLLQFFDLLKPTGYLLYSDIFIDNYKRQDPHEDFLRMKNMRILYNLFIEEVIECVKNGTMIWEEWNLLCGDGVNEGLLRSMRRAIKGLDDYNESLDKALLRLVECGYKNINTYNNEKNEYLFVISSQKNKSLS